MGAIGLGSPIPNPCHRSKIRVTRIGWMATRWILHVENGAYKLGLHAVSAESPPSNSMIRSGAENRAVIEWLRVRSVQSPIPASFAVLHVEKFAPSA